MSLTYPIQILPDDSLDGTWSPWQVKSYTLGQVVQFAARAYVEGVLTDQNGIAFALVDDAGAVVATAAVQHDGVGLYHSPTPMATTASPGAWVATWSVAGQAVAQRRFYVDKGGSGVSMALPSQSTLATVNATTGPYVASALISFIAVDLSGGALTGTINIGANAVKGQIVTIADAKWLVNGATLMIPVTGGSIPIQDPSTGALVTGAVQMKGTGQVSKWVYDGTNLVLAA